MTISVVIPAYNESKCIAATIHEVQDYLNLHFSSMYEILVVDDGSTDDTCRLAEQTGVRVVRHGRNSGKGAAVKTGIQEARGQWILFMDADNSTKIHELDHFQKYWNDFDFLIGSRALQGSRISVAQPYFKQTLGRLGNKLIQLLLLPGIHDSRCGFKLMRAAEIKPLAAQLTLLGFSFDDELLFLARSAKLRIKELPVTWINNFDSKVRRVDYLTTIFDLFRVKFNYLRGKYTI